MPKVSDMQSDPCGSCAPRPLRGLADLAHHAPTWPWACPRPNIWQPISYASLTPRVIRTYATLASRTSKSYFESNSLSQRGTCLRTCPHACVHPHMPPICPRMSASRLLHASGLYQPSPAQDQSPPRNLTSILSCLRIFARKT